jgi:predicted HTH transcriptional regulator
MTWIPLSQENASLPLKTATKRTISDFKETYDLSDPTKTYELAKDVVAFTNNLGGTILVGVVEGWEGDGTSPSENTNDESNY